MKTWQEKQKAWQEKLKGYQEEEQKRKYEKKKYIDEDGVWIPRIVKLVIFILFFWLALNIPIIIDDMMKYR